jgi:hypothetical protein
MRAARIFHAEMHGVYVAVDAGRFAAIGGGFAALISQIADIRVAPVEHQASAPQARPIEIAPIGAGCWGTASLQRSRK